MTSSLGKDETGAEAIPEPADGVLRYRCLDYTAYYAGDDFKLFESSVTGARHVLPAISEQLLKAGERFLTLDEQAAIICQVEPFRAVPVEMVRELLTGLASSDLLISHQDLAARCTRFIGEHRRATIGVVGIPTCNRPGGLRRVASTMAENAARHGRRIEIVVADDSDDACQIENIAVLREIAAQYGIDVWYAGPVRSTRSRRVSPSRPAYRLRRSMSRSHMRQAGRARRAQIATRCCCMQLARHC